MFGLENITETIKKQRDFFRTGKTKSIDFRLRQIHRLKKGILQHEKEIENALWQDLGKAPLESYATEIGFVLAEIRDTEKHLCRWSKPKKVSTPLYSFPAESRIYPEPYGVVLVMAPWNYPFQLAMAPLLGALAAGNCAVVKLSEDAPKTAAVIEKILTELFPPMYVSTFVGGREVNQALLAESFDYIFFTGSPTVGKVVMEAASKNLTPVSLELGGKSPCIVDKTADIPMAAKRIVWGKFTNAGQTCVAPDYLLVESSIQEEFVYQVILEIRKSFGGNPQKNQQFPKIVNEKQFNRLQNLIKNSGELVYGGRVNPKTRQIEPTILEQVSWDDPIMQEEIFGPIMPIIYYNSWEEIISKIAERPKPLAAYLFSTDERTQKKFLEELSFGGGCINETLMHMATPYMPFGGVGNSGMGGYHGKWSFDTFSHYKGILKKENWFEPPVRYAPYTLLKTQIIKKIMR